eukprot:TRINITY_DN1693_c0_g1_i1.p1 TRINITY_DN1693_c0_g1~~TRINITY_DN1693_c0_g1_i1.p1  ORF type:complete len:577 (-),score=67.35 TRINITY_DN1693_c0_g1_i1:66-1616(-)
MACPDNQTFTIYIALKHSNADAMEKLFWQVSDPDSTAYGKYLSLDEVGALFGPDDTAVGVVQRWLAAAGVHDHTFTAHREWIKARVTVATARVLLGDHLMFHYYHNQHSLASASNRAMQLIRAQERYTVPADVAAHISLVGGVNEFPRIRSLAVKSNEPSGFVLVTPDVIKSVLNIGDTVGRSPANLQAVAQFLGQYFTPADLTAFQKAYHVPVQQPTLVVGPNVENNPGVEAELDIQYIMGVANNVPTWFVSTGGEHEGQEPFLEWITKMISTSNSPWVHSISYGDTESSVTRDYTSRVNEEFMKFGIMGKSIIFASGDDGVGCNSAGTRLEPNWPSSSPYVTSVGGSLFESVQPITIVSDQISSGGFSNYFSQPAYQSAAVSKYLNSGVPLPPESFYNRSGRATPDVAVFSEDVEIYYKGGQTFVGGTSCAAPVFSAVISLVNDHRLLAKKVPLGFLNPILYSRAPIYPRMFMDVTHGPSNAAPPCAGFSPANQWDPVSGWGLPNFSGLISVLG